MKEPMITGEMKVLFTLGGALVGSAVIYGWISGGVDWSRIGSNPGQLVGALSVGYKGPVGDHTGYAVLLGAGLVGLLLGTALGYTRLDRDERPADEADQASEADASAEGAATVEAGDAAPAGVALIGAGAGRPIGTARVPWPLAVALGLALVGVGLALDRFLVILGLGLAVGAGVGWWETAPRPVAPAPAVPPAPDPLVAWIGSSARGVLLIRAVVLLFAMFGVYVLFASFASRSGMALLGIALLAGAVALSSWVEVQFGRRRAEQSGG